ncbi:hypothetical protein ES703_49208 [subsurface metagenome]
MCHKFNEIFKELGTTRKNPRICSWERLKDFKNNCEYAGERIQIGYIWINHAPLCVKYRAFYNQQTKQYGGSFKRYFTKNAEDYLKIREQASKRDAMSQFLRSNPRAQWFPQAWEDYLKALDIKEETILQGGGIWRHCIGSYENGCKHNPHTDDCIKYRKALDAEPEIQVLEGIYREWRKQYLSGPKKPSFRYPSKKSFPLPKIFGAGFYRVDFERSILELRLDDMHEGEFVPFGFAPWPDDYEPQPQQADITSVHINFAGTRARVGFRFSVQHKESRFKMNQDEIDELRSRKYPRQAQDQIFLDEARQRLLASFQGDPGRDLKILTVDLGTIAGYSALFEGKGFQKPVKLKTIKIDRLYDDISSLKNGSGKAEKSEEQKKKDRQRGLGKEHVGRHLESWAAGAQKIAEARGTEKPELGEHDMRRLALHIQGMLRDWVRLNTAQIIKTAEQNAVDLIIFESMRGYRAPGYEQLNEDRKNIFAFFAAGRIRRKTAEKAVERGMRVVTVPYLKSSQFCAVCGKEQMDKSRWLRNKRKHIFICEHENCNNKSNSDENAARVLGRVFWGEIKLPVT